MLPTPIEVTCRDVHARREAGQSFLLLDCREADEYATAKIEGAVLIPMSTLVDRVGELESYRDQVVIVHCHHGGRSLRVANWLRNQGFSHASSMAGGIDEWSREIDTSVPRY